MRYLFCCLIVILIPKFDAAGLEIEPGVPIAEAMPDFSYAGYRGSEVPLPVVDDSYTVLEVEAFGAVPDDGRSDRQAFIKALKKAEATKGPVVIRFGTGRYILRGEKEFFAPPISINRGDLVIQGAGSVPGGTELHLSTPSPDFAVEVTPAGEKAHWRGNKLADIAAFGPAGSFSVEVANASSLKAGMWVQMMSFLPESVNDPVLQRFYAPNRPMPEGIAHFKNRPWVTLLSEAHQIDRVEGNKVVFREPIFHEGHETGQRKGYLASFGEPIEEVGFESLAFTTDHEEMYFHYMHQVGDGFNVLEFENVVNSWARDLRFRNYTMAISLRRSSKNTVRNVLLEGNPGHQSIVSVSAGYGNLFSHIREFAESHHGLGSTGNASVTVFHRCVQFGSLEAHCGHPRATLFDRNDGLFGVTRVGGATYTPHHGRRLTFWNWRNTVGLAPATAKLPANDRIDFWPTGKKYGYFMAPAIVGLHGHPIDVVDVKQDVLLLDSVGQAVDPDSLFEYQLARRLNALPSDLREASSAFENDQRFGRAEFDLPRDNAVVASGRNVTVRAAFPGLLSSSDTSLRVQLLGSNGTALESAQPLAELDGRGQGVWRPETEGVWKLWLRVETPGGSVSTSRPVHVLVADDGKGKARISEYPVKKVWFQHEEMYNVSRSVRNQQVKEFKDHRDVGRYRAAIDKSLAKQMRPLVDKRNGKAADVVDGDAGTHFRFDSGWLPSAIVLDLGTERSFDVVNLLFENPLRGSDTARIDVQVSDDRRAIYSYSNDDRRWTSRRRLGETLSSYKLPSGSRKVTVYLPETQGRYVRIFFHQSSQNSLSEVSVGKTR
ncbi:MAG: DUF4955 domain-containing protein [Planctomycetota bacterium]